MKKAKFFFSGMGNSIDLVWPLMELLFRKGHSVIVNAESTLDKKFPEYIELENYEKAAISSVINGSCKPDYYIYIHPNHFSDNGLDQKKLQAMGIKTVYIPYATEFQGEGYDRWILSLDSIEANIIFASSPMALEHYKSAKNIRADLFCAGIMTSDILYSKIYKKSVCYQKLIRFKENNPALLYTPHWSARDTSWLILCSALYEYFSSESQKKLIIRPHPSLKTEGFREIPHMKKYIGSLFELFARLPNVYIDESISPIPAIAAGDFLLSDVSAIIQQFWPTGKPMACTYPNGHDNYGAASSISAKAIYPVRDADEGRARIQSFYRGEDSNKKIRERLSTAYSGPNDGKCAQRVYEILMQELVSKKSSA